MLSHLFISNYALIEKLDIDFPRGFITITGETGAGKSVLLGAIGLLMGNRADISALSISSSKCIIEGMFEINDYHLKPLFEELDLDYEDQTIIRREITPAGKSRAFLNDTPVSLKILKQVGEKLMDIHAQFSTLQLADESGHLKYLDKFANIENEQENYSLAFRQWSKLVSDLKKLQQEAEESNKEEDYLRFSLDQLNEIDLNVINQNELEEKRKVLENSEAIKATLYASANNLVNDDDNLVSSLKKVLRDLSGIASYSEKYSQLADRLDSIIIEVDDIGADIDTLNEELTVNPVELEEVQQLLDTIYRLQQKFHVATVEELVTIRDDMEQKLSRVDSFDRIINEKEKAIAVAFETLKKEGAKLSSKRVSASKEFAKCITQLLEYVNLNGADFNVLINHHEEPAKDGFETASFMFSANKGIEAAEIGKVASGGELSRLMLAVKAVISKKNTLPTIIFDEIEAGVSGAAAGKIASVLAEMGKSMQVITITHLPQIASKGICQFKVSKYSDQNKTTSRLELLSATERVNELAVMLSDGQITSQSLENAKSMLNIR